MAPDICLNCGRSSSDITTTYKGMIDNAKKIEILENALKFAEKLGNEIIWDNQPVSAATARIQFIRCIEEYKWKKPTPVPTDWKQECRNLRDDLKNAIQQDLDNQTMYTQKLNEKDAIIIQLRNELRNLKEAKITG